MSLFGNFSSNHILKQNMLESLRDYPREFIKNYFFDYGVGIISGFNIEVDNDKKKLIVHPGIAKFSDGVYFSIEDFQVDFVYNKKVFLFLKLCKETTDGGINQKVELVVCDTKEENVDDAKIFLCQYLLGQKAELKVIDNTFISNPEMGNIVDNVESPKSIQGGSTVHDNLLLFYAHKVLLSNEADINDIIFAYQILNGIQNINIINYYFDKKCNNTSNKTIWEYMISKEFKKNIEAEKSTKKNNEDNKIAIC